MRNFAGDNRDTYRNIYNALTSGDVTLAHRLAHTLKGVAALINKTALQTVALEIERPLDDNRVEAALAKMRELEHELDAVLSELENLPKEQTVSFEAAPSNEESAELLFNLHKLLEANDSECLDMIDNLRRVQGTETLIKQIEEYDFDLARKPLLELRSIQ